MKHVSTTNIIFVNIIIRITIRRNTQIHIPNIIFSGLYTFIHTRALDLSIFIVFRAFYTARIIIRMC